MYTYNKIILCEHSKCQVQCGFTNYFLHFTCKIAVILKYVTCHKLSHAAELLYVTINSQIVVVAVIIVIIIGYIVVEFKK